MLKSQSGTVKVSAGNIVISEIDSNFNSIFRLAGSNGVTMELKKWQNTVELVWGHLCQVSIRQNSYLSVPNLFRTDLLFSLDYS